MSSRVPTSHVNPFRDALELRLWPSRGLGLFVVAVHTAALLLLAGLAWRQPWLWLMMPALPVSGALAWRRTQLRGAGTVRRLLCHQDGSWHWECTDGRQFDGRLRPSSRVLPAVVLLHVSAYGSRRSTALAVAADSVDARHFRHLRVRLKLYRNVTNRQNN